MEERKSYVDTLYGGSAMARTKEDAWYLICEKCKDGNLPLPSLDQIIEEIYEPEPESDQILEEMITISITEYDALLDDRKMLYCLQGAGVDNWQGYDDAMEMYENYE